MTTSLLVFYTIRHLTNLFFFFFNDTATTEIYTLSLHDALPIFDALRREREKEVDAGLEAPAFENRLDHRSEEHTSELQSPCNLVCRLLLEKKKKLTIKISTVTDYWQTHTVTPS